MRPTVLLTILGMAVATYLTRVPLLLMLGRRRLPLRLRLWLRLVPLAVLPALAVPMVLLPGGKLEVPWRNPQLWGVAVVLVCSALRLNLLLSVGAAVGAVAIVRYISS